MFKNFSANIITKNTNATIIPEFKTNADGLGFFSRIFLTNMRVKIKTSEITSRSFIKKNRNESLEKKSNRYIKIDTTMAPINQRLRFVFILEPVTLK